MLPAEGSLTLHPRLSMYAGSLEAWRVSIAPIPRAWEHWPSGGRWVVGHLVQQAWGSDPGPVAAEPQVEAAELAPATPPSGSRSRPS